MQSTAVVPSSASNTKDMAMLLLTALFSHAMGVTVHQEAVHGRFKLELETNLRPNSEGSKAMLLRLKEGQPLQSTAAVPSCSNTKDHSWKSLLMTCIRT